MNRIKKQIIIIAIAALTQSGCGSFQAQQQKQTAPQLDSSLAANCKSIEDPPNDSAGFEQWVLDVLENYADCAARHHATVEAWPK